MEPPFTTKPSDNELWTIPHRRVLGAQAGCMTFLNLLGWAVLIRAIPWSIFNSSVWVFIVLAASLLGVNLAQFCFLAIWSVMARGSYFLRMAAALLVGFCLYAACCLALWIDREPVFIGLIAPLVFLAGQSPLWPMRAIWGGWLDARQKPPPHSSEKLRIADLFAATTVVAATLAMARIGTAILNIGDAWITIALWCLAAIVYCGIAGWLSFWAVFVARRRRNAVGLVLLVVGGLGILAVLPFTLFERAPILLASLAMTSSFHLSFAGALMGMLAILRRAGYRMRRELLATRSQAPPGTHCFRGSASGRDAG